MKREDFDLSYELLSVPPEFVEGMDIEAGQIRLTTAISEFDRPLLLFRMPTEHVSGSASVQFYSTVADEYGLIVGGPNDGGGRRIKMERKTDAPRSLETFLVPLLVALSNEIEEAERKAKNFENIKQQIADGADPLEFEGSSWSDLMDD